MFSSQNIDYTCAEHETRDLPTPPSRTLIYHPLFCSNEDFRLITGMGQVLPRVDNKSLSGG